MFVPQQKGDDPVRGHLGDGADGVAVYTTDPADFFVFNDGSDVDPSGRGFPLCKLCGLLVTLEPSGTKRNRTTKVKPHRTPFGRDCPGAGYDHVHLGHDFRSSAARLRFTGLVRAVHHLHRDPDDRRRRLFLPGKCNVAVADAGLAFTLEAVPLPTGDTPRVAWEPDPIAAVADDFIGAGAGRGRGGPGGCGTGGRPPRERAEATDLLLGMLADGPKPVADIRKAANAAGLNWRTVQRAKDDAGITSQPKGGTFVAGEPPEFRWGIGDDWLFPEARRTTAADASAPDSHGSVTPRPGAEPEPVKGPEISEERQPPNGSVTPRGQKTPKRRGATEPPPAGTPRETTGDLPIPPEE